MEQILAEFHRVFKGEVPHVGEDVVGSPRYRAFESDAVEDFDHQRAFAVIMVAQAGVIGVIETEGKDRSVLERSCSDAREEVVTPADGMGQCGWGNGVTDSPAGDIVCFRAARDDDPIPFVPRNCGYAAMGEAVVDHVLVDFVGDGDYAAVPAEARDEFQLVSREYFAAGVIRVVDENCSGPVGESVSQPVAVEFVLVPVSGTGTG